MHKPQRNSPARRLMLAERAQRQRDRIFRIEIVPHGRRRTTRGLRTNTLCTKKHTLGRLR